MMEINDKGIFSGISFWKLGCNWGSNKPSFYTCLKNRNVVIGHKPKGIYNLGDLVLVAEGYTILAVAKVKSKPVPIKSDETFINELKNYHVDDFERISFYSVDFYEIPLYKQFKYELRQGIVQIHKEHIKKDATQIWQFKEGSTQPENRLMRITWNTNNWEYPSGHKWSERNQGNSNIAYENQYGYGHEEWLLDERFRIGGYQYGYIRGIEHMSEYEEYIPRLILFTIDPISRKRFLVGEIKNLQIIEGDDLLINEIKPLLTRYFSSMISELKKVNADFKQFKKTRFLPNVRFRWDNIILYNDQVESDYLRLNSKSFTRFQPYVLQPSIYGKLTQEVQNNNRLVFESGVATPSESYFRSSEMRKIEVFRTHTKITNDLSIYLRKIKGYSKDKISIEKTRVGSGCIDAIVEEGSEFIFFEVKTSAIALKNIRQALGQIIEYAFLDKHAKVKKLVIVGPASINSDEQAYLKRLNKILNVPLEYWFYNTTSNILKGKFIET